MVWSLLYLVKKQLFYIGSTCMVRFSSDTTEFWTERIDWSDICESFSKMSEMKKFQHLQPSFIHSVMRFFDISLSSFKTMIIKCKLAHVTQSVFEKILIKSAHWKKFLAFWNVGFSRAVNLATFSNFYMVYTS